MKSRRNYWVVLSVALGIVLGGHQASAQDPVDEGKDIAPAVTISDIEILNNRLNAVEKSSAVLSTEHNYLDIATQKGDVVFKIGGVVQGDYRSYFSPGTKYDDYLPIGSGSYPEEGAAGATTNKSTTTFLDRKVRLALVA